MKGGWVGKILEIDLSTNHTKTRPTAPYLPYSLGGRALAAQIAYDELPPDAGPFDPENLIIIATGPFTGTVVPTAGRTIMTSISPRIYPKPWYTHSTLGGWFGPALKYCGFDAIILRGRAENPVMVEIVDGKAKLIDARDLWGKDARETQLILKARINQQAQVMTIGPAGERLVRFATVQHAEENAAGHSGFGAVWGSKNLKAIVAYGTGSIPVAHPKVLINEIRHFGTYNISPNIGPLLNRRKSKPRPICSQGCTFNCLVGNYGISIDGRTVPGWCIGGQVWMSDRAMESTSYQGGGMKVPAASNFGMCEEVTLHERCNSLGLDQWFRLVIQPWLIALEQQGIKVLRGYPIAPKDVFWFADFLEDLAYRRGLGELFADDLRRTMDTLKNELPADLIALGHELEFGFGFPAHREGRFWDEEPLPFWVISAMMYISESRDPAIGSHNSSLLQAEFFLDNKEVASRQFRKISRYIWGFEDAFEPTFLNKAPIAIWSQNQHILIDSLPLCDFAFPLMIKPINTVEEWEHTDSPIGDLDLDVRLLDAVTGLRLTRNDLTYISERAFSLERMMLARAGRSRVMEEALQPHFQLPCRSDGTLIDRKDFLQLMDEYYIARGWDLQYGWPLPETLRRLGLEIAIPELERLKDKLDQSSKGIPD